MNFSNHFLNIFIILSMQACVHGISWHYEAYIKASEWANAPKHRDYFGYSVAIDNNTMVVGAPHQSGCNATINGTLDGDCHNAGAAFIFRRSADGQWREEVFLKASNAEAGDKFGYSVAIFGDRVVVGAPEEDSCGTGAYSYQESDNNCVGSGSVYVFVRKEGFWSQEAYIKASNTDSLDHFGSSVAVNFRRIVVGAPYEDSCSVDQDDNSCWDSGAVYVFHRRGGDDIWSQRVYIKQTSFWGAFGASVAIHNDLLVIGAPLDRSCVRGVAFNVTVDVNSDKCYRSGAAIIFRREKLVARWNQEAYLKASNADVDDLFGTSVAVFGERVAVGARSERGCRTGVSYFEPDFDDNDCAVAGAVYMFQFVNGSFWQEVAYVKASRPSSFFGVSLAINTDTLVVGAHGDDACSSGLIVPPFAHNCSYSGALFVFERELQSEMWSQSLFAKASNHGSEDYFGFAVALSGDTIVVGAHGEDSCSVGVNSALDDNSCFNVGAAYVIRDGAIAPATTTPPPPSVSLTSTASAAVPTQITQSPTQYSTKHSVLLTTPQPTYSTSSSSSFTSITVGGSSSSSTSSAAAYFTTTSFLVYGMPGNSLGATIGFVLGGCCLLCLLLAALFVILRVRRRKAQPSRNRRVMAQSANRVSERRSQYGGAGGGVGAGGALSMSVFPKRDTAALSSPRRSRSGGAVDTSRRSTRSRRSSRRMAPPIGTNYARFPTAIDGLSSESSVHERAGVEHTNYVQFLSEIPQSANVYDLAPDLNTQTLDAAAHYVEFPVDNVDADAILATFNP